MARCGAGGAEHIALYACAVLSQVVGRESRDGKHFVTFVFVAENVPSMGYRIYRVEASDTETTVSDPLTVASGAVTTPALIVNVDAATGQVSRLYDRAANREVLPAGQQVARLVVIERHISHRAGCVDWLGGVVVIEQVSLASHPARRIVCVHLVISSDADGEIGRHASSIVGGEAMRQPV